jgi:hypothetical protein
VPELSFFGQPVIDKMLKRLWEITGHVRIIGQITILIVILERGEFL